MKLSLSIPHLQSASRWVIAYSGGMDSHVLLHVAAQQKDKKILAVHVNHGLHPDAYQWEQHCRVVCAQLGVEFASAKVHVDCDQGESVEAAARTARYTALKPFVKKGDVLLIA